MLSTDKAAYPVNPEKMKICVLSNMSGLNYDMFISQGNVESNTLAEFNSNDTQLLYLGKQKQE